MNKTIKTELYDMDSNNWYIEIEKTDIADSSEVYYTIKKEHSSDGRSKSSIQLDEEQMNILMGLLKEMIGDELYEGKVKG